MDPAGGGLPAQDTVTAGLACYAEVEHSSSQLAILLSRRQAGLGQVENRLGLKNWHSTCVNLSTLCPRAQAAAAACKQGSCNACATSACLACMSVYVRVGVVTGRLSRGRMGESHPPNIKRGGPFNIYSKSVFVRGYFLSLLSGLSGHPRTYHCVAQSHSPSLPREKWHHSRVRKICPPARPTGVVEGGAELRRLCLAPSSARGAEAMTIAVQPVAKRACFIRASAGV